LHKCYTFVELADKVAWIQHGYSKNFEKFWKFQDNAERINESDVTTEQFVERYEKPYKPVIIQGVQNVWRAQHKWTIKVVSFKS
jgi:histone arginine demethylase JMJD6